MSQGDFIVDLIASLQEGRSRKQIQAMAKRFVDIKVPLTGTLDKARTKSQIERDVASLKITNTVNLQGKVNKNSVTTSAQQVAQQAQNIANKRPIRYNAVIRKDKLISDIKILGQQYSKLHKDANMSAKYNTLLDNAKLARSSKDISNLRAQLSAFRSELKANNLATLSFGDALKKTFKRATQLFTGTGLVMLATRQIRQAWTEALNLDKAYTNLIKVQNELTRSDYPSYLERCNKMAKELATTQQALIESTTEFSKSGYNLTDSNALATQAQVLSNVGEMSASDSAKAIISGIQAFDIVDGYTDVEKKAQALIDKYNEIGNTASITTAEIAQGVQKVGSVFADANTSVDEFISLVSAGNRQFQDANTLSLALRTSALRIRGCTAELELMGEETDTVVTSTAKLEEKIKALTNINGSGGVEILEADGETFRSIYDIYVDIAEVYKDMSDTDSSALLELIAGKHRASAISATLNNMSEAQEIYQRSLEASGSAQREYDKYLESSNASLNIFKATLTEAYQSVFSGSTTKTILDSTSAILNLANSLGLIEKSLMALLAIGAVRAINKLGVAFKTSTIQASNFGTSLKTVNTLTTLTKGTTEYANAMNVLKVSTVGLSEAQLRQVLSNKALTDSQRIEIMRLAALSGGHGKLSRAQAKAKLTQMGLIQSTNTQTNAQNVATTSTFRLTSAVRGFGTSLKTFMATNKFTIAIMTITTLISGVKSAIEESQQEAEEYIQKQDELIYKQDEIISSTESRIDSLEQLKEKLEETNGSQAKMLALTDEINDVLGAGKSKILENADAYTLLNAQLEREIKLEKEKQALANKDKRDAAWDKAKNITVTNTSGVDKEMSIEDIFNHSWRKYSADDPDYLEGSGNFKEHYEKAMSDFLATGEELTVDSLSKIYADAMKAYDYDGLEITEDEIESGLQSSLDSVYTAFDNLINNGEGFLGAGDKQNLIKQFFLQSGGVIDDEWRKRVDEAIKFIDTSSEDITLAFDEYKKALRDNIEGNEDVAYDNIVAIINGIKEKYPEMSSVLDSWLADMVSSLQVNVSKAIAESSKLLDISETVEHLDKKVKPVMDSLKSAYQDIFTEDGFTLDNVGVDMLNSVKEAIAEINELDGVDVPTSAFEDFAKVLSTTEITMDGVKNKEEEVHKAFNNLVGDIVNGTDSAFVSSEAFNTLVQSLEEMGVTNANEALNEIKKTQNILIEQGADINNITAEEAKAFLEEAEALGISTQWFKTYTLQKAIAENPLDTTEDIEALENLCNVLGVTGEMFEYVNSIKFANQMIDFHEKTGMGAPIEAYQATIENAKKNIQKLLDEGSVFEFEFNFDGSDKDKKGSKSDKDKSSDIDWIETKLNNVDKALDKLNNTIDDTYSNWTDRSKALKDAITDTEKAIGLQGQAYTKYMQKAESIKLPEYLKERVRLGDMSIQNDVNSETKELIDEYSEWYEKAQEAKEAQDELNKSLLELKASDTVDMIEEYYDAIDETHSNLIESTQNKIDKAETMGFFANGSYYENISEELAKQKANLEKKKADLDKVLANSGLDKNSSSYTELENLIGSISNEIQQLTIDIEDNKNAAQENEWNYFDYLRESVTRLIEEADFFIELMSNEDLFDDKGNFTKYADATLALHNSNYEVYMANAREYAEEMKALEEDIANGIIGGTLAEDRYRELEDARRDAIQSAQDEKNAILDLVENGLQKELDYLNEIIDKKRESLKQEKSLFDYQKSIEEKTKTRDSLRRQLDVYKNDNSEEGLAQVQKLSVELQKAEDAIAETEMEKAMDDVESMLNDISSEYEEWINARLDNEDELLRQIQDKLGENGDINSTLKEISEKYGVSMSDSLKTAIVDGKPFEDVTTAIENLIDKISGLVDGNKVESNSSNSSSNGANSNAPQSITPSTTNPSTSTSQTDTTSNTSSKDYDNIFVKKKYSKQNLDIENSLVDRLKSNDIDASFPMRAKYWSKIFGGTYTGSASQNRQFMSWLKENGYKNGTFSATKGWHLFDELGLGSEVIITKDGAMRQFNAGDKVINSEGTSNLFTFANDPQGFLEKLGALNYAMPAVNVKMPDPSMFTRRNATNGATIGNVNIEVGQVVANDPIEFASQLKQNLANNRTVQKMIQEVGLGGALGHNSMNVKKYL